MQTSVTKPVLSQDVLAGRKLYGNDFTRDELIRWFALEEQGYGGWIVVEQDVLPGLGTPRESASRNRAYLRSLQL